MTHRRAHVWAMGMIVGGLAMSLAGNFQAINLNGGRPGVGAYVSAFIWPSFLFGVIEVMLHTPWLVSWRDRLTKGGALVLVAFVAAWISYWHLAHVMTAYGYDTVASHTGPLAVDIGMVLATLALDRVRKAGQPMASVAMDSGQEVDGQLDSELAEWDRGVDMAIGHAGQELANEAERFLASGQDGGHRPVTVVASGHVSKPIVAMVANEWVASRDEDVATPQMAKEMLAIWLATPEADRPTPGDMYQLLAAYAGVSPRSIRRWRTEAIEQTEGDQQ